MRKGLVVLCIAILLVIGTYTMLNRNKNENGDTPSVQGQSGPSISLTPAPITKAPVKTDKIVQTDSPYKTDAPIKTVDSRPSYVDSKLGVNGYVVDSDLDGYYKGIDTNADNIADFKLYTYSKKTITDFADDFPSLNIESLTYIQRDTSGDNEPDVVEVWITGEKKYDDAARYRTEGRRAGDAWDITGYLMVLTGRIS